MTSNGDNNLTFTIHGLQAYNDEVDGEVFAAKFYKLMLALKGIDTNLNGKRNLKFLISKLEKNTATAAVREKILSSDIPYHSGINYLYDGIESVKNESSEALNLPEKFVKFVCDISKDAGHSFEKGYLKHSAKKVPIKIDEKLYFTSKLTLDKIKKNKANKVPFFKGNAIVSLDGSLVTLEGSSGKDVAYITLTVGGQKIKCLMDKISDEDLRSYWKARCMVTGLAYYSGNSFFPDYINIYTIQTINPTGCWTKWRGAFDFSSYNEDSYE